MQDLTAHVQTTGRWQHPGVIVLATSLCGAVAGALVPSSVMGRLRMMVPGFATAWDWLDASLPGFNPLHAIAFAWVALVWRLSMPNEPRWRMPALLVGLGIACELLQSFVPTRQPRVTDVLSDVAGIAVGWAIATTVNSVRARRRVAPPAHDAPP